MSPHVFLNGPEAAHSGHLPLNKGQILLIHSFIRYQKCLMQLRNMVSQYSVRDEIESSGKIS